VPAGPGVRWDGGIEPGSSIGLHYDSLLGKLIVWAGTREAAIERMRRALHELRIVGVETSREFHLRVMEDDDYRRGDVSIQWLEQRLPALANASAPDSETRLAAVAAALLAHRDRGTTMTDQSRVTTHESRDAWRDTARRDALR
jgi:acetyl-CoA carboxylase biotin carboxylase subunit